MMIVGMFYNYCVETFSTYFRWQRKVVNVSAKYSFFRPALLISFTKKDWA